MRIMNATRYQIIEFFIASVHCLLMNNSLEKSGWRLCGLVPSSCEHTNTNTFFMSEWAWQLTRYNIISIRFLSRWKPGFIYSALRSVTRKCDKIPNKFSFACHYITNKKKFECWLYHYISSNECFCYRKKTKHSPQETKGHVAQVHVMRRMSKLQWSKHISYTNTLTLTAT